MPGVDLSYTMAISTAHDARSGAKLILLAEDSAEDAQLLQLALREAGVVNPIVVLSDGLEVVDYLAGNRFYSDREKHPIPGVLLLDLKMPKVDGFQVLEWCQGKSHLKDLLVAVISGHQDVWRVSRAYKLGARTFLVKPCSAPEILNLAGAFPGFFLLYPVATQSGPMSGIKPQPPAS
jgi:CheY-like chemotaxis protein